MPTTIFACTKTQFIYAKRLCQFSHQLPNSFSSSSIERKHPFLFLSLYLFLMGNAASCAPSIISNNGGVRKVLSMDGRIETYTRPVKAAELMVENPGQFVCESTSLKVGNRIQGLSADEELEKRQLYLLLPMDLLYSVLTFEEMSSLTHKTSKALKHGSFTNFGKILPVLSEFCIFPSEAKTLDGTHSMIMNVSEPVKRYSKQRSWRPALETIAENPCRSH